MTAPDGFPLALVGLWSRWSRPGGEPVVTFTIVTTTANEDVAPLHDRMPALLSREEWGSWLDRRSSDVNRLCGALRLSAAGSLVPRPVSRRVSRRVTDARNDHPALLSA